MDKDFQAWREDLQRRIVERGLDKFQLFRFDKLQPEPHWVMEYEDKDRDKVIEVARQFIETRMPNSEDRRYDVRVFDKDNNRDIDLIEG